MLPSPPLTADSCCPSPRSLKRRFSDAADDAYTPPATPPLKRRRCPASLSSPAAPQDIWPVSSSSFDPEKLVTPPEYTHVPYDPDFGRKVCRQYKKSLVVQRACDAVTTQARKQKYGEAAALAHSPGSTPDHIRRSYEDEQRRLDEAFAEIIANSESESEPNHEDEACVRSSKELQTKSVQGRIRTFETSNSKIIYPYHAQATSRDIDLPQPKHIKLAANQHMSSRPPLLLRSDDSYFYTHTQSSNGFTARAQSASRISQLRRRYKLREQYRSSLMVGS